MDLRTLTKLILKLLGIYFLVASVLQVLSLLMLPTIEWFFLVSVILYFIFGAACVWLPGAIINRVLRIEGGELEGAVTANRLFGVGVALLGLYLSVTAFTALIFTFAGSRWFYRFPDAFGGAKGPDLGPEQFASLVTYAVQLILGLGLWLGWRWVTRFTGMENDR
jgi:hypothetical protein